MEKLTEEEFKNLHVEEEIKDVLEYLDTVLDGEVLRIHNTEIDITLNNDLKPVLPDGLKEAKIVENNKNKNLYAYILKSLIALLISLNPIKVENEEDYCFRIAIITNIITSGCVCENKNWIKSDRKFDKIYIKNESKKLIKENEKNVNETFKKLNSAYNFLAFSAMNMVRFNHHFPNDKINLISKSISALPEEQKFRIMNEDNLQTFYTSFVTAARVMNDKSFYEKFILKKKDDDNLYNYYPVLGIYNLEMEEEIIQIRSCCTPNGYLILDIINEIINDIKSKKLFFLLPYRKQFASMISLRNYLRKNPYGYHPAKYFYKCAAENFSEINSMFQTTMKEIGSFVYQYSEQMYESVREAKCRIKYSKNIKKDDEIMVKNLFEIANSEPVLSEKEVQKIKEKLYTMKIEINEETNVGEEENKALENFNNMIENEFKF